MKTTFFLLFIAFATNSYACKMTKSAMYKKTALEAIDTLNSVDEVIKEISVSALSANLIFTREIIGSVFCVERNVQLDIDANCEFSLVSKKDNFIKMNNCLLE